MASGTSCTPLPPSGGWGDAHLLPAFGPSRWPRQFHTKPGDAGPWRRQLGPLLTCIGVQISMSPNGVGGGDLGLAGVPC